MSSPRTPNRSAVTSTAAYSASVPLFSAAYTILIAEAAPISSPMSIMRMPSTSEIEKLCADAPDRRRRTASAAARRASAPRPTMPASTNGVPRAANRPAIERTVVGAIALQSTNTGRAPVAAIAAAALVAND